MILAYVGVWLIGICFVMLFFIGAGKLNDQYDKSTEQEIARMKGGPTQQKS